MRCGDRRCCPPTARLCPNSHMETKKRLLVAFRTDRSNPFRFNLTGSRHRLGVKVDRSLIAHVPRDKYFARCKQRAFANLDRGDLRNAVGSFVSDMSARPGCELPQHLAALGDLLLMKTDASGWRTRIEGLW